jgi:hypothetical protein
MAIVQTTLSAPVTASDLIFPVTSATGFGTSTTRPQFIKVDDEFALIDQKYNTSPFNGTSTNIPVYRRGDQGSSAVAHGALAIVITGLLSDLVALQPSGQVPISRPVPFGPTATYGADGAITVPPHTATVLIDKGSAAALTLAAPAKDQDGLTLTIISVTPYAHVVTATTLVADGVSGSPHTTMTFAAFKGASITLRAEQGLWTVIANNNVVVT